MNLITLLSPYAFALILTLIIEGALCYLLAKSSTWLKFSCLVNLFTNPLVNFFYTIIYLALEKHGLVYLSHGILVVLEITVWLSESYLFYRFGNTPKSAQSNQSKSVSTIYKAMLFSLILNAASYGTGLLLHL